MKLDWAGPARPWHEVSFDDIRRTARILVLDGNPSILVVWRHALSRAGYQLVTTVDEGRAFHAACRSAGPDLVVLDLDLPDNEGWALLEDLQIQTGPKIHLPVMAFSRSWTEETRLRALLLGTPDLCPKPFDPVETLLRLRLRLEVRYRFVGLAQENAHLRSLVLAAH